MSKPKTKSSGPPLTIQEAGALGGKSTLSRYGAEFYRQIGRKGGKRTKAIHPTHLATIGKKGGARTGALIAAGKQAEQSQPEEPRGKSKRGGAK